MYDEIRKGAHSHRFFVDADTREKVCLCGAVKDESPNAPRKFHNRSSEYNGYIYQSQLEMRYAIELDWRLKAKEITAWERQVKIPFDICLECARVNIGGCPFHPEAHPQHLWNYYVDFLVHHNNGDLEYAECKGMVLPEWRMKWAMMEAIFGNKEGVKLTVVRQSSSYRKAA